MQRCDNERYTRHITWFRRTATAAERFTSAGYGEHAQSWVGGDPLPVTGNQINEVFTPEEIQGWASKLGVDPDKMRIVLAEAIPQVVDHLTPSGQVPTENATAALSGLVGRLFTPR